MVEDNVGVGSLVLYKKRPALVERVGEKLEIKLPEGRKVSVRLKDVTPLHPGPVQSFGDLRPPDGDVQTAWELLSEAYESTRRYDLAEVAELIYGEYSPAAAWAIWQLVEDDLYFSGTPHSITAHSALEVADKQEARQARQAEAQAWDDFVKRVAEGEYRAQDERYLKEVEALALGNRKKSRVLKELGRAESPETAHALLLDLDCWDTARDPYPARFGLPLSSPSLKLPELPQEERLDLTHLEAFAIDDPGNVDPDDALSLEGERLWVHVADAAALVAPDSALDHEARARGANLYLPDRTVQMLPSEAVPILGLGLADISPALSFGINLNADGGIADIVITPSRVRVQRLTYEGADERIGEAPFEVLERLTLAYRERRRNNGALFIDLPEVRVSVGADGLVSIRPVVRYRSRAMVQEAMLMAGGAAAGYAIEHGLPFPYAAQEPPSNEPEPRSDEGYVSPYGDLAAAYAMRRSLKSSQVKGQPAPHAGIGLEAYSRVTSPLRRYLDLVAHQQLRSHLLGGTPLDEAAILERIGASEAVTGSVRHAEWRSRKHWTLVYLIQNPGWSGKGVLVEKHGPRGRFIIPELALETQVHLREELPLNAVVELALKEVDLPGLEMWFWVR